MNKIVIAIDGYSACGKSSTAKQVAARLGYHFIDSGAMYRAVTLFFLQNGVETDNTEEVTSALNRCNISFSGLSIFLNEANVDEEIRSIQVNESVSRISAIPEVRKKMVKQQKEIGRQKGVVMDGRDIGTVVFPDAELKIFMTAEIETRAKRRQKEMSDKGMNDSLENIVRNLLARDHMDSTRKDSPLRKAEDAVEIDTTDLTLEGQIAQIVSMAKEKINAN
ncbi:MAG: (d)CMP kinase [Cyclobacteriaceae bacterium]